jgi:Fungal specific transcription factor domain
MIPTFRPPEEHYVFPEEDLLDSLVDLYFSHLNIFYPLLHRPTFDKCKAEGLHLVDNGFGATVLLVCAIGCRFSEDPRVSNTVTTESSSTAWFLFNQVGRLGLSWYSPHSLYDLQVYPVSFILIFFGFIPYRGVAGRLIS